ncbi:MAG: N-acetyl-gamma-glutamyl-phosphate reductase [Deltaproteobacteria bacterium]|nr:N-acetyl-gamma-glutamyl-phosphate reductase [Deltaproteobacteria bacterium]
MFNVFIDGQEGTTGLKIHERLIGRKDIHILEIPNQDRKNSAVKKKFYSKADIVLLCLPDDAAKEAAALIGDDKTRIIDSSTAFRTAEGWVYGIPELKPGQRELIKNAVRVTNPGCHATGFNMALYPLMDRGIVPQDYPVAAYSLTGYSGGGKKLINVYEGDHTGQGDLSGPRHYALTKQHKHIPEMHIIAGLKYPPMFMPVVGNFYQGMVVSIPLETRLLSKKVAAFDVREILAEYYGSEPFVRVIPFESDAFLNNGYLAPTECNHTNRIDIFVFGNDRQILLMSRLDNLGKGASGAAVQNMNIMLGIEESTGLDA